jgi:hypothetical protein
MRRCAHWSHSSTWPPRAAVRQTPMSRRAFLCWDESVCPHSSRNSPYVRERHRPLRADVLSSPSAVAIRSQDLTNRKVL